MAYPTRVVGTSTFYPTWISNPQVNSGALINLSAKRFTKSIPVFTTVRDTAASSVSATYEEKLSRGVNTGFGNPIYNIQSVVDLTASHTTGSGSPIDFEFARDLVNRSDQYMVLYDRSLITTTNVNGTSKVMLKNYSDSRTNDDSKEGFFMTCNFEFVEVK